MDRTTWLRTGVALALTGFLALTGCGTPGYVETGNLGPASSDPQAIAQYFSNSFFPYPQSQEKGRYYGADGSIASMDAASNYITVGTWSVRQVAGGPQLCEEVQSHAIQNGAIRHSGVKRSCQVVYLQPDGGVKLDEMGGPSYTFPKPLKNGYPERARFEELRRKMGV